MPPKALPVAAHDVRHAATAHREDLQPEQHGPKTVFFTHVVAAGPETFFAAERDATGIQEISEELPAGWCLEAFNAQFLRHHINSGAGWHGAGDACQT